MSDDTSGGQPLEGEVQPPAKGGKPKKPKKPKGGGAPKPSGSSKGFGRQQSQEERDAEEAGSKAFFALVAAGGFDWRYTEWEPTEQQRDAVKMLKFCGYNDEDIAYACGMSVESLIRYFGFELKTAKMLMIGDLAGRAFSRARHGNDVLTMFLLKTRGGSNFSERANAVAALADSASSSEEGIDSKKRAELVEKILDLLSEKKKPKADSKKGNDE